MALIAALFALFAGWMLWGWLVSEHRDIVWMRQWCSGIFVITAILISAAGGSAVTAVWLRKQHRAEVRQLAESLESGLQRGQHEKVRAVLRFLISPPADSDDFDGEALRRMSAVPADRDGLPTQDEKSRPSAVPRPRLL